jgi:hypothetical protein
MSPAVAAAARGAQGETLELISRESVQWCAVERGSVSVWVRRTSRDRK